MFKREFQGYPMLSKPVQEAADQIKDGSEKEIISDTGNWFLLRTGRYPDEGRGGNIPSSVIAFRLPTGRLK